MNRQIGAVGMLQILHGVLMGLGALGFLCVGMFFLVVTHHVAADSKAVAQGADQVFFAGSMIWFVLAGAFAALAWIDVKIGDALRAHRPWARMAAIIRACLHVINFPVGTLIGAWTLTVLTDVEAVARFKGDHTDRGPVSQVATPPRARAA